MHIRTLGIAIMSLILTGCNAIPVGSEDNAQNSTVFAWIDNTELEQNSIKIPKFKQLEPDNKMLPTYSQRAKDFENGALVWNNNVKNGTVVLTEVSAMECGKLTCDPDRNIFNLGSEDSPIGAKIDEPGVYFLGSIGIRMQQAEEEFLASSSFEFFKAEKGLTTLEMLEVILKGSVSDDVKARIQNAIDSLSE